MDQETLSKHLNLSRTSIINIEKGRQRISLEQAWMAASVLDITISELLPPTKPKSIDEWTNKMDSSEVSEKVRKVVIEFISKAKSQKR